MPKSLGKQAAAKFRALTKLLTPHRILTDADVDALAVLASALAQYDHAEGEIAKYGTVIKSAQGVPIQSPYMSVQRSAWERIKVLLPEFGLTPSARVRLGMVTEDDDNSDDEFSNL
ncbi:MAG: phage terminase small subunit P27 family [Planctomycetota bacterium]